MASSAPSSSSLVLWGNTGRRLQFSKDDLKMPEHIHNLANAHFYEKQWDSVASFWCNRVLKDTHLQQLSVADLVARIEEDIHKRWLQRRKEQALHKKKKRLMQKGGPAGDPSLTVLLTNVVGADHYRTSSETEQAELVESIIRRVEEVSGDHVLRHEVLLDSTEEEPPKQKRKVDEEGAPDSQSSGEVDDRMALVCQLSSEEKAATAIAMMHGSRFDGRTVICRFWT